MVYNTQNAKETAQLPQDSILDGVIKQIKDGKVKDFVHNTENWKGSIDGPCIQVLVEVKNNDKVIEIDQVFTYNDNAGITEYSPRSNLGKFKKKYGKLPEPGMQIKVTTNSDGFGNLKLD